MMGVQVREELDEKEKFIGELVYRYLTIFQFNCHAIVQSDQDSDYDFIGGYVVYTSHPHPPSPASVDFQTDSILYKSVKDVIKSQFTTCLAPTEQVLKKFFSKCLKKNLVSLDRR